MQCNSAARSIHKIGARPTLYCAATAAAAAVAETHHGQDNRSSNLLKEITTGTPLVLRCPSQPAGYLDCCLGYDPILYSFLEHTPRQ